MNPFYLATGLLLTFFISLFSISLLGKWARKYGLGDVGGERHQHLGFIPVIGGMGIFIALFLGWSYYIWAGGNYYQLDYGVYGFFAGMLVIHIAGVADDVWRITPGVKFFASALAAALFVFTNPVFTQINIPLLGTVVLGNYARIFSLIWIIGLINAINLIDGIDGLAGGVSIIILAGISFFAFSDGDIITLSLSLFLIAALLGFLVHNFPPAKVFMGDGGSLILGFTLGTLPQRVVAFDNGYVNFFILLSLLMLPFVDTANAFIRRMLQGRSPFRPDKEHFHHRIIALGASPRQAMLILWLASLLFVSISIKMYFSSDFEIAIWFLVEFVLVFALVNRLGYLELRHKKFLPKWKFKEIKKYDNAPIIFRKIFHKILLLFTDTLAINFALWFYIEYKLVGAPASTVPGDFSMPVVGDFSSILLTFFWVALLFLNNLYDLTWDTPRVDRLFSLAKVTLFGVLAFSLLVLDISIFDSTRLINIGFYWFMLTFSLIALRFLLIASERKFRILEYAGTNTIIVGCNEKTVEIIEDSKKRNDLFFNIVGCVDNPPSDIALGSVNDLPRLIHNYQVEELIITGSIEDQDGVFDIVAATENLGVRYKISKNLFSTVQGLNKESILSYPLIRLRINDLLPWQKILKRLVDISLSLIFIIMAFLPVLLYSLYLLVRRGKVWRKEIVIGRYGRPFYLYKWVSEVDQKGIVDRIFHRLYLNKFTFFLSILFNQLSLVGPQIQSWREVKHRLRVKPHYRRRFMLKPGIIGPTQLASNYRGEKLDLEAELERDTRYLEDMSIGYDFKIMISSISLIILKIIRGR